MLLFVRIGTSVGYFQKILINVRRSHVLSRKRCNHINVDCNLFRSNLKSRFFTNFVAILKISSQSTVYFRHSFTNRTSRKRRKQNGQSCNLDVTEAVEINHVRVVLFYELITQHVLLHGTVFDDLRTTEKIIGNFARIASRQRYQADVKSAGKNYE